jgi:hypothetical protein
MLVNGIPITTPYQGNRGDRLLAPEDDGRFR